MSDDERTSLEVKVARIEERQIAQGSRLGRVEWLNGVVAVAVIGAIVTRVF